MAAKRDPMAGLKSASTTHGRNRVSYHYPQGSIGIFMRVTLAVIYMYLLFAGYLMMGIPGVVIVSTLFIVALLFPIFRAISGRKKKTQDRVTLIKPGFQNEAEQQG